MGPGDTDAADRRCPDARIISYNSAQQVFSGTAENTTSATVTQVRVEIHLSNGVELGPTPRVDLAAGETKPVELDAGGQSFTHYSDSSDADQRADDGPRPERALRGRFSIPER